MPEKFASVLVTRVYLTDHGWLYQNLRFHPLPLALKTSCVTPRKLRSDAVPECILQVVRYGPCASCIHVEHNSLTKRRVQRNFTAEERGPIRQALDMT